MCHSLFGVQVALHSLLKFGCCQDNTTSNEEKDDYAQTGATSVKEALSSYVIEEFHMWSDSSTVLHWLEGKGRYKQFVEHRVREICSLVSDVSWKVCPTDENLADLGTRGKHRDNCRKVNFGGRVHHGCAQPGGLTNHTLTRCIMTDSTSVTSADKG